MSVMFRLIKLRMICNVGLLPTERLTNCDQLKGTAAEIGYVFDISSSLGQMLASSIAQTKADSFGQSCYCLLLAAKTNRLLVMR
jgi:hypothetical protein